MPETRWRNMDRDTRRKRLLELVVLLQPNATPLRIHDRILDDHGKNVSMGYLYYHLEKLETSGHLRSETKLPDDPERIAARGRRKKRYYYRTEVEITAG